MLLSQSQAVIVERTTRCTAATPEPHPQALTPHLLGSQLRRI